MFGSAGSAYFTFDFNEGTPTNTTSLTILNSQDTAVMTNTGLEGIAEDRNFKGVWADSATAFTTFTLLKGVAMDEAELTTLVGMVKKGGIKTLTTADYNHHSSGTTDDGVALWLLNDNFYKTGVQLKLYPRTNADVTVPAGTIVIKSNLNIVTFAKGTSDGGTTNAKTSIGHWLTTETGGAVTPGAGTNYIENSILTETQVANNLTTSSSGRRVLDAAQGKVLNDKIEGRLKTNAGAPTTSTAGTLGQLLTDTTNAKLYQLTAIDTTDPQNPSYTWSEVGGSSVNVVQTTGTSTTDVMSQNAVTSMVFGDPSTKQKVQIGVSSNAYGASSISIGDSSYVYGDRGIAIGSESASVRGSAVMIGNRAGKNVGGSSNGFLNSGVCIGGETGSSVATSSSNQLYGTIALGYGAKVSQTGEMNIGSINTSYGYNSSNYRLLSGVYDPQSAHDAATKGYADTKATITMTTTDPGEGASIGANELIGVYS